MAMPGHILLCPSRGVKRGGSRGSLQENPFKGPGHVDGEETRRGITVVFAALIYDPQIPMALRLLIGDDSVQLPDLQ
jgi:hypothetical protein